LKLLLGNGILEAVVIRIGTVGKREIGAIHIGIDVVVAHFILAAIATDVVGDIGPRAKPVDLGAFE
jgi:hypothetical protein